MIKQLIAPISKLLDKIIPDADKRQDAKVRLAELASTSDNSLLEIARNAMQSMNDLNMVDAKSEDKYRTRWRPTIGWICVFGLGWEFIARPFAMTVAIFFEVDQGLIPSLDMSAIMALVTTLLGMGSLRTYEKIKGQR